MKIFTILALLLWALPTLADTATVVEGTRVNLRSGKSDIATVVKALEPGTTMEVLRQEQSYVQVKTQEGDTGWLPLRFVKITPSPKPAATNAKLTPPNPPSVELEAEAEKEKAQAALVQSQSPTDAYSFEMCIGMGLVGLIAGILLGVGGLQAYYRRKLNGLRI